jgi:hypothetical protein
MTVAVHEATAPRMNQPGLGALALPPIAGGMSVCMVSPLGPVTSHLSPSRRRAVAGTAFARAFSGLAVMASLMLASAALMLAMLMVASSRGFREFDLER